MRAGFSAAAVDSAANGTSGGTGKLHTGPLSATDVVPPEDVTGTRGGTAPPPLAASPALGESSVGGAYD